MGTFLLWPLFSTGHFSPLAAFLHCGGMKVSRILIHGGAPLGFLCKYGGNARGNAGEGRQKRYPPAANTWRDSAYYGVLGRRFPVVGRC